MSKISVKDKLHHESYGRLESGIRKPNRGKKTNKGKNLERHLPKQLTLITAICYWKGVI